MTTGVTLSAADLAGYALKAMWRRRGALIGLCAPALLIIVAAAVLGRVLYPSDVEGELPDALPLLMLASFVANVALVPAFTGWHRLLIRGSLDRGAGPGGAGQGGAGRTGPYGWDRREWRYFGFLLGIWCLMFAVNVAANIVMSLAPSGMMLAAVLAAMLMSYLAVWANLGLALPAAALGDPRRLSELLRLAAGNLRQIAMAIGGVWILLFMIGGIAASLVGAALLAFGSVYLVFVVGMLFYYVGLVGSVGVLSRAYERIIQAAPPAPPGAPRA